jgi:hypothetical protein
MAHFKFDPNTNVVILGEISITTKTVEFTPGTDSKFTLGSLTIVGEDYSDNKKPKIFYEFDHLEDLNKVTNPLTILKYFFEDIIIVFKKYFFN